MIDRCAALGLRVHVSERVAKRDVQVMLTVQTMNYLHNGHHKIAL
jgi:pantothenate synthetase